MDPYLIKGVDISKPNKVWAADITYVPLKKGFAYLVAVIDWFSRYLLSWQLSNSMDSFFCVEALELALARSTPDIFNTDQGAQFTSKAFTETLKERCIAISMDGRGRAVDNIMIERFWRTLKYEDIYLKAYDSMEEANVGIGRYISFYNEHRPHQSLEYKTPLQIYQGGLMLKT